MSFPGVKTSRDGFLVNTDLDPLRARIADYFDAGLSHEQVARRYPEAMQPKARYDARAVRDALLKRGGPDEAGFVPSPSGPSTALGSIGKRTRSCSTRSAPTTGRMCRRGTCGWSRNKGRAGLVAAAVDFAYWLY